MKLIKGALIGGVFGIATSIFLNPNIGCKYNGSPRPNCSTNWFIDKKGDIFVLTWSDGEKTTIRQTSKKDVLINEKNAGTVISTTPYLTFKNSITGSTFSVPPSSFGSQRVNQLVENDGELKNKKTSGGQFWNGQMPGTGTLAIGAIGGLLAGGAISLLYKGKSEVNTKSNKSGISESTSVDETIKSKPELPVEPVAPTPLFVDEKAIETPPPLEDKQVSDKQNYQRVDTDAETKSYTSNRSIEEIDNDLDNQKEISELKEKIEKLEQQNKAERQRSYMDSDKTIPKAPMSNDTDQDKDNLKALWLIGILVAVIGGGVIVNNWKTTKRFLVYTGYRAVSPPAINRFINVALLYQEESDRSCQLAFTERVSEKTIDNLLAKGVEVVSKNEDVTRPTKLQSENETANEIVTVTCYFNEYFLRGPSRLLNKYD